jgi:hypothetical protein
MTILARVSTDAIRGAGLAAGEAGTTTEPTPPTTEMVAAVAGDRCAKCQAPLARDQRYCVNCGERRGRARFSPATFVVQPEPRASDSAVPPRHARFSSAATLVAGVATLLIAMGVGVLIGHYSAGGSTGNTRTPAAQIIRLGGGAAASTTAASTPTTAASTPARSAKVHKTTVVHVSAKTAKAANAAASKVLGSGGSISHNVTQQVGQSCSGGAGCQNGKFTGNFFSGG